MRRFRPAKATRPRQEAANAQAAEKDRAEPNASAGSFGRATRGLSVAAFLALQRAGSLLEGPRAELLAGAVSTAARLEPREAASLIWLERELRAAAAEAAGDGATLVERAVAFRLGPNDLLRADLALLSPAGAAGGMGGSTDPKTASLIIEVMRGRASHEVRAPLYAAAGAKELWLLDVSRGWTEVLRSPWRGLYRSRTLWYPGEVLAVPQLGGIEVGIMPRP